MKGRQYTLSVLGLACLGALVGLLYVADLESFQKLALASAPVPADAPVEQKSQTQELTCSEPITVGVMTDLTGPLALYGTHIERSFPLGMEYVAGPPVSPDVYLVDSCEIRLIWGDDQSNQDIGEAVARELIEVGGAQVLVGTVSSGVTAKLQEIAAEYNILHIVAPAASNDITGISFSPNTFPTSRNNYQDAMNLCEYLASQDSTLVQFAPDSSFGWRTADTVRDACSYFGASFVTDDIFAPMDATDFTPYAQQILNSGADACIVTWAGSGIISLFQDLADAGVMDQMAVTTSFVDNASMPIVFGNMVGETGGILYHYTLPTNDINDWLTVETTARYGVPPDLFYADGMNAALLIIEALKATDGDISIEALIAAMEGMSFEGPKGTISIRPEDHVAIQDMYIVTLLGVRLLNLEDTESPSYDLVTTNRPTAPCLLPTGLQDRCGDLPIGSLIRRVFLPLVLRNK
jgi:branched-chain amino acid transport system substrate-binding protein